MAGVIIVLVLVDLFGLWSTFDWGRTRLLGMIALFRLDFERNAPTCLAMLRLLSCALLTALRARVVAGVSKRLMWAWLGVTAAFSFVAIDEYYEIHEQLVVPVRRTVNTSGVLQFAWVIPLAWRRWCWGCSTCDFSCAWSRSFGGGGAGMDQ